ncbi:polyprenyl synthetase family protein [Burkholderia cenocepacia]|uniref:polyprenyl synthetase family protein n=1 Tax=Burkholderia cenocepacia TaxID=95486 RepID=UPI0023B9CEEA|nr:farnesyl diphosphate synthase [Burkholderia cenocepacia]MDF0506470.1 polyprenyl synthetase family protein [Burkholderia cenocepacia]
MNDTKSVAEAVDNAGATTDPSFREPTLSEWGGRIAESTRETLEFLLPASNSYPTILGEAIRYAMFSGGKRVRPMLCHAAGELTDADPAVLNTVASVVEMIHIFSLIQDDLPEMDDDDIRHGKPATHVRYGVATALLSCDALITLAFQTLSELRIDSMQRIRLIRELSFAAGFFGMTGGQFIDISSVGKRLTLAELERMHQLKTGALTRAAVRMGAICGQPSLKSEDDLYKDLTNYADNIGLAFQVVDDILDVTKSSEEIGKTANKDLTFNKPTYATLLGLGSASVLVEKLAENAHFALCSYGAKAIRLHQLIDFVASRRN